VHLLHGMKQAPSTVTDKLFVQRHGSSSPLAGGNLGSLASRIG
jgi:hypothetical protein